MPAALDINRNEVEMNVRQYGVRETARMMGLNENTVLAWARRGEWLSNIPRSAPLPPTVLQPAINALSGPKAQAAKMQEDNVFNRATALALSRKKLGALVRKDEDELLLPEMVTAAHQTIKDAALAGAWQSQAPTARINLSVTAAHEPVTMEATVIQEDAAMSDDDDPLAGF